MSSVASWRVDWRPRSMLAVFFLAMLAGCAVGPDYQRPDLNLPASYLAPSSPIDDTSLSGQKFVNQDVPAEWWMAFHSVQIDDLVRDSLAHNPNVEAARASLKVARENVLAQQGAYYPSVQAGFTPSRERSGQTLASAVASNATTFNLYTAQLTVSYAPDVFGLNRRQVESLQAQAKNQLYQLEATYLTLTSNAVNAAIQEAALREQLAATRRIVEAQQRTVDLFRRERALGQVADADVLLQEASLATTKASLPVLQKELAVARDSVAALAGRYPSDPKSKDFDLADISLPNELPQTLPSKLVEHRPDILAAEELLHAASADVGVAIANRLPNVMLGVDNWGSASQSLSNLFAAGSGFWTLTANITQPVFDGGILKHRQTSAEAAYEEAAAQYRATVINAFQNVADSLQAVATDAAAVSAAADAEKAAAASLAIAQHQLALGDLSPLSLLILQQTYQNAEINLITAQSNRLQDAVALFQALGGGWWNRPPDSLAVPD
jgi:NodT family efflux transporter outer membrane factor (OMF) lipoprotein